MNKLTISLDFLTFSSYFWVEYLTIKNEATDIQYTIKLERIKET